MSLISAVAVDRRCLGLYMAVLFAFISAVHCLLYCLYSAVAVVFNMAVQLAVAVIMLATTIA